MTEAVRSAHSGIFVGAGEAHALHVTVAEVLQEVPAPVVQDQFLQARKAARLHTNNSFLNQNIMLNLQMLRVCALFSFNKDGVTTTVIGTFCSRKVTDSQLIFVAKRNTPMS